MTDWTLTDGNGMMENEGLDTDIQGGPKNRTVFLKV